MGTSKLNKAVWQCSLLVFSGRPNPGWKLTAETAAGFERQAETAPVDGNQQPWPPVLGYSGIGLSGAGVQYVFFNGRIAVTLQGTTVYKTDAGRAAEKALLKTVPAGLMAELQPFLQGLP